MLVLYSKLLAATRKIPKIKTRSHRRSALNPLANILKKSEQQIAFIQPICAPIKLTRQSSAAARETVYANIGMPILCANPSRKEVPHSKLIASLFVDSLVLDRRIVAGLLTLLLVQRPHSPKAQ